MQKDVDVLIVGGGPGGSTLAALLAKQGVSVRLFERSEFPRFRIGESLLPYSLPIWERSGVLPKIEAAPYLVKHGARFVVDDTLEEEVFWFKDSLTGELPKAFQVQRGPFDVLLLDHAKELGVTVHQPCNVTGYEVDTDGVSVTTDDGEFRGKMLADATGRWTMTAAKERSKVMDAGHRKISVFAHYRGVERCEQDAGNIIIVRFNADEKGWFWLIPFADGTTSVGVVSDLDYFKSSDESPEVFLDRMLSESRCMAPRMANAERVNEVRSEAEFTYAVDSLAEDRVLRIGDAGMFIDPVFSSGILLSTLGADLGATAIVKALKSGDVSKSAFANYESKIRDGAKVFRAFIDAFYHRDFLNKMVTSRRRPIMQQCITSLLAGDVFNEKNTLIPDLISLTTGSSDGAI